MVRHLVARLGLAAALALLPAAQATAAELLGTYLFEGDFTDSSGMGNDATLNGAVPFAAGFQGQAASFSANAANFLEAPIDVSQQNNATMTWGAWVNTADAVQRMPISVDNGSWDRLLAINGGQWGVANGAGFQSTGIAPTLNTFQFVAASYDGSTINFHLDGYPVLSVAESFATPSETVVDIGRNANAAGPWNGLIDNVFIFDETLNNGEIQAIRNLALDPGLQYNPAQADLLLDLADGTSGGPVTVDDLSWEISSDPFISTLANDGEVGSLNGRFFLRLDSTIGGLGLAESLPEIPEPSTLLLAAIMLPLGIGHVMWKRRRRQAV